MLESIKNFVIPRWVLIVCLWCMCLIGAHYITDWLYALVEFINGMG